MECSVLVTVGTLVLAIALPHSVGTWFLVTCSAVVTAGLFYVPLARIGSVPVAVYLGTWGAVVTAWLAAARILGPWHADVLAGLILPSLALAMLGPVAIGSHLNAADRDAKARDRLRNEKELRKWETLLARLGVDGVKILDVVEHASGRQVHGRLGRVTEDGPRPGTLSQLRDVTDLIAQDQRLHAGAVSVEQPPGTSSAEFVLHLNELTGPREITYLPAENQLLTVNRALGLALRDDGREWSLKIREINVLIAGVTGSGKALALDTSIPTPAGWATMGEIQPGDFVYGSGGQPCRVLAATEVMHGRPCYRVQFSDGTEIIADADHQWRTYTRASRRWLSSRPPWCDCSGEVTLTTEQMIPDLVSMGRSNYSVIVAGALQCPDADLPVPPYTMGAWLGDGWTSTGAITTMDPEILAEIEAEGETVWIVPSTVEGASPRQVAPCALADGTCAPSSNRIRYLCVNHWNTERRAGRLEQWPLMRRDTTTRARLAAYRIGGLSARLRTAGTLGNKHIPVSYLRASESQRRALLAGLLDTDGYCTPSGTVEFSVTRECLARDTYHLVCSLGYKATLRSKIAMMDGKDCGTAWTVAFTPAEKVFRLSRKLARQVTKTRLTAGYRYVTAIEPVPSVPVRCIEVDSPDHLYLASEACIPTHNSNLMQVFIAQLSRCVDVIIFMIDLKGGRAARPWMVPWIQGFAKRPVIDWLATTPEEANLMLEALWAAREDRSRSGAGGEKITPSADLPAILLLTDEAAVLFGHGTREGGLSNTKMARRGLQLAETGRSEAVNLIVSAVRANVETLGNTGVKAMSRVRIGMAVTQASDGQSIFPDDPHAAKALSHITDPGSGLAKVFRDVSPPLHFYRITDGNPDPETGQPTKDRITPIALWAGEIRPQLDDRTMEAMGDAYAQRWTREHGEALKREWGASAGVKPPLDPGDDETLKRIAHLDFDPEAPVDPRHARLREILIERRWQGATVARLNTRLATEGLTTPRETVQRWLREDEKAGMVRRGKKPHHLWKWIFTEDDLSGTG